MLTWSEVRLRVSLTEIETAGNDEQVIRVFVAFRTLLSMSASFLDQQVELEAASDLAMSAGSCSP